MRTTQAARYASWAAAAAILIAVAVAGVYAYRAMREASARRNAPPAVPPTVQQRSAEFSFSKVEQERTLFTVRASRATEFKDQSKSLLEDVWISIYGRQGSRNDNIHTRQCNYEPSTGHIVCQGEVQLDLESAEAARRNPGQRVIHVSTKNVSFDRETGEASTDEPVHFRFPSGEGSGVGVSYSTRAAIVRLQHEVELKLSQPDKTTEPVVFTGSSLEYVRSAQALQLDGPVRVRQGGRELNAGSLTLELDSELRARRAVANGHPELRAAESSGLVSLAADEFQALLNPAGWMERILAEGGVRGSRKGSAGEDHFSAQHVDFEMEPAGNEPRRMTVTGDVKIETQERGESRRVETAGLELRFVPGGRGRDRRVESGETLAPAVIESKTADESTRLHADRFTAQFDGRNRLQKLLGHSAVRIDRQIGAGAPQVTTAQELAASLGPGGEWAEVEVAGKVQFRQAERTAHAERARMVRAADSIALQGSASVADALTRTTAAAIEINQRTGELRARGGVLTSYLAAERNGVINFSSEPAHISAEQLVGNSAAGHALYTGRARLWQGDAVIEADAIELLRGEKHLEARGDVIALFPQAPGPHEKASTPTLWRVTAPKLDYWSEEGKARLEDGVSAESQRGTLLSRTLDLFLSAGLGAAGARQLTRAVAAGGADVRQEDRHGTAEQAEYTAAEGKFVLSGGQPTLTDASRDTTTGRQLTFFIASDTILVDSQAGSRTLTRHRIEK